MSQQDQSKTNLIYFESPSMRELYDCMKDWQISNNKRFVSLSIQHDGNNFCCIAIINPDDWTKTPKPKPSYEEDMERFQRKALKHIGVGVDFESSHIPLTQIFRLQRQLEKCTNPQEVKECSPRNFRLTIRKL